MKRERSESVTVVGDEYDVCDPDCVAVQWTDLRAERRAKRVRQVPGDGSEVIVLDD